MATDKHQVSEEQLIYARWLEWGVRCVFTALALSLAAYLSGQLSLAVPIARLPELWGLPAKQFIVQAGVQSGWGWLSLGAGEVLLLGSIACLLSISTLCLCCLPYIYARRRDWWYLAFVLCEIVVLVVAASDLLALR